MEGSLGRSCSKTEINIKEEVKQVLNAFAVFKSTIIISDNKNKKKKSINDWIKEKSLT